MSDTVTTISRPDSPQATLRVNQPGDSVSPTGLRLQPSPPSGELYFFFFFPLAPRFFFRFGAVWVAAGGAGAVGSRESSVSVSSS